MRSILLALLPFISALQLPHLPTPQDAFQAADDLIRGHGHASLPTFNGAGAGATKMSLANDMTLAMIPGDEHVLITSARHPDHSVRIKSTDGWCDPDVRSYSGYLDTSKGDGRDLFFYFFESRNKPKEDPVIMWINGGPGCSSALGLFMELGPCAVKPDPKSVNDTKANIFFLDEPIGVGFSKAAHGQTVATAEDAAKDVQAFISIFFEAFKEFEGREFHMAGESYGGRYLPLFASAVVDGNKALIKEKKTPINLQSVLIGNGITDFFSTMESYYPFQCTLQHGLSQPVQSISACVQMAEAIPKCHKFTTKGCIESHDYTACTMAINYCEEMLGGSFLWAGVNPYDVSKPCTAKELETSLCYDETDKIKTYLDLPDVRATLGVSKDSANWSSCSNDVGRLFSVALDSTGQTWLYVSALLERGIRVLNYAGTLDFICNHVGNEMWMNRLQWTGQEGFNEAEFVDFKVKGEVAGKYKTYGNLSLLKIYGAGHMVPFDKPAQALQMLNSWIGAKELSA
ncbi:hypothetical protein EHS25_003736 [Saitozyma podzolica]|uniref:Carboxypeptidase n=1 Tax=Saitozyma podzolica TaxID=1890683 RepID=A0A427Y3E0_9TREE|nr:hypothetical protein EHS25_003736 [Saitozyma podzolica]